MTGPPAPLSPLERLVRTPTRFDLDQAAFLLAEAGDPSGIRFRSWPRLSLPPGEVIAADPARRELTAAGFGLIGPGGVLPRHWTATVAAEARKRSTALHDFLDLLARRFTGQWIAAGAKVRPARNPAAADRAPAAAIGLATPRLAGRLATPLPALLHHAGHLAARSPSAERLAALLSVEAGVAVEIVEFAGGWTRIPPAEQTRLAGPGAPAGAGRLGVDAVAGAELFDPQARFVIRLGPLDRAGFERFLPGRALHRRLSELARLFVGPEQDFVFNLVLAADAVPPCRLGAGGARLGWTGWLPASRPRRRDAEDARLAPAA